MQEMDSESSLDDGCGIMTGSRVWQTKAVLEHQRRTVDRQRGS